MDHGSHRLHLMVVALLLCMLLPIVVPGGAALAQFTQSNQGEQAEPAKPETPAPAAIPVAEVSIRAQEVAHRLESFAKLAEPDPDLAKIREDLGVFEDSLETRKQRPGFQELDELGERRLEDLATEWKRYTESVKKWESSLPSKTMFRHLSADSLIEFSA